MPRRDFMGRLVQAGLVYAGVGYVGRAQEPAAWPSALVSFPGPWAFDLPKSSIILVSDQQLEDLQDPDKEVDLSLSPTPNRTTLRRLCAESKAAGARTIILAFDEFWSQYRPGQGGKPRALTPDMDEYIQRVRRIGETLKQHGLGLELSLLSPLEIGPAYRKKTGESGRWVQYREGYRDPETGRFSLGLWEQQHWTNNKGTIAVKRVGIRAFAFRERRVANTQYYYVNPAEIVELSHPLILEEGAAQGRVARQRRLTVRGDATDQGRGLDRVLLVVSYETPELDYFSPTAGEFLKDLMDRYHQAGVPLNGLYADEMHIQQDWGYFNHHDEGQFTCRYLTKHMERRFAELYGAEFADFEKYLVYFAYGQHAFYPDLEARLAGMHVMGADPDGIQRAALLRRRYFDLLDKTVVGLFVEAKEHAEKLYGHELESRAHATWAQSPTIDLWRSGASPLAPRQYEYTSNFLWSNTVHQAASACSDYFRWNDFLTGGGNDHAEGGWSDRDYYGLALACSTGILNRVPNAYAAAWGMPNEALQRHQALQDAYGAAATPWFKALEFSEHRDAEVLMLYPISLVAAEERFGSWMVQYGYANYVTPEKLLERGRLGEKGWVEMAGRRFRTIVVLFEPLPPAGLLAFLNDFAQRGGIVIWSGPPPRLDLAGASVVDVWQKLFGVQGFGFGLEGQIAAGGQVAFEGPLAGVPSQTILTDFLVDLIYPVVPAEDSVTVARTNGQVVGLSRASAGGGSTTYLGFRPRDDQAASLGYEVKTWFEILRVLGAYPGSDAAGKKADNPSVVSRQSRYLATRFPNGTVTIAAHYRAHVESWGGGFHRDDKADAAALAKNPLPSDQITLNGYAVAGHLVDFEGRLIVGFRLGSEGRLIGFAGRACSRIQIDGREHTFAQKPMNLIAWAPISPDRRVAQGAIMEIWVEGESPLRIPMLEERSKLRLVFAKGNAGEAGDAIPFEVKDGFLQFEARAAWGQRRLYLQAQA
jgi:hypothetical protein